MNGETENTFSAVGLRVPVERVAVVVQQVVVVVAEGVVDLGEHGARRAVGVEAVPERDRVEAEAEHAREREQAHPAAREVDVARARAARRSTAAAASRRAGRDRVAEASERAAVVREAVQRRVELVELGEVEVEVVDAVAERVLLGARTRLWATVPV